MKIRFTVLVLLLLLILPVSAYRIRYAEQFYRLYHLHLYQDSDNTMENVVWLEQALLADFCNPLYALAEIKNKNEWKHYRYLFKMHVNLKLVELYRTLGNRYDKRTAFFYNAPWRDQNLDSLDTAQKMYETALFYWDEARSWSHKLRGSPYHLEDVQKWEDEHIRIQSGDLDYRDLIEADLARVERVRQQFTAMDEYTY